MQKDIIKQRGFTMVELIIAIAILSVGVVSVYSAFSPIIALTYTISSRLTAAYLTQEGLEITRSIRDNNFIKIANGAAIAWSKGLIDCNLGCQADFKTGTAAETFPSQLKAYNDSNYLLLDGGGFYNYEAGDVVSIFKRKITATMQEDPNIMKVSVEVMWHYNGQPYNFQADEFLYNWK